MARVPCSRCLTPLDPSLHLTSPPQGEGGAQPVVASADHIHRRSAGLQDVRAVIPERSIGLPQLRQCHEHPHVAVEAHILLQVEDESDYELHLFSPIREVTVSLCLNHKIF